MVNVPSVFVVQLLFHCILKLIVSYSVCTLVLEQLIDIVFCTFSTPDLCLQ